MVEKSFRLFLLLLLLSYKSFAGFEDSPRYRLIKTLFGNSSYQYSRYVFPSSENNSAVIVDLQLALHQILDVDQKNEVIKLNFWSTIRWANPYLRWNPSEFDGLKEIHVDKGIIWTPDLTLWNRAIEQQSLYDRMDRIIKIDYKGLCTWKSLVTTTSSCTIKVEHFPFDMQNCTLQFGSWNHPSHEIRFRLVNNICIDLSVFSGSREWKVKDTSSRQVHEWFAKYYDHYDVVYCDISLLRDGRSYIVSMVAPFAIIALLVCLTFYLPPDNGERVSLVLTVLLAMTVYLLIAAESMPAASHHVPMVEKFYLISILESVVCLIASCIVVNWQENTGPMPCWIYVVFNCYLPKILFLKWERDDQSDAPKFEEQAAHVNTITSGYVFEYAAAPLANGKFGISDGGLSKSKSRRKIPEDWSLAARSLNRLCLVISTIVFVGTTILFFGLWI